MRGRGVPGGHAVLDDAMAEDPIVTHRSLLFTVAYEMLGSAADAEDVVQESWLRWADVDQRQIRDPRAYLIRIVTRQSLNRMRTLARQREDYVGDWLPEPLLTTPDVAEDVELAESVSIAMLTLLETLNPAERAVFVLREVFAVPYDEIAEALDKTPAATRQIAHRARTHVEAGRTRMRVAQGEQEAAVERFLAAIHTGDVTSLLAVLAPDVVLVTDGGGLIPAARRPIAGADKVARFLSGSARAALGLVGRTVSVNGAPALWIDIDGALDTVASLTLEDGRISRIYAIRNPHKLTRLGEATPARPDLAARLCGRDQLAEARHQGVDQHVDRGGDRDGDRRVQLGRLADRVGHVVVVDPRGAAPRHHRRDQTHRAGRHGVELPVGADQLHQVGRLQQRERAPQRSGLLGEHVGALGPFHGQHQLR